MTRDDVARAVTVLSQVADFFPSPLSEYVKAGLALVQDAIAVTGKDPLAQIEELVDSLRQPALSAEELDKIDRVLRG